MLGRAWPQQGEPLFLPEDTELALAFLAEVKLRCSGCGHPQDETTAVDERGLPLHDYEARSTVCQACEATEHYKHRIAEDGDPSAMYGRVFYVRRVDEEDGQ